jgi:hypothetical protein
LYSVAPDQFHYTMVPVIRSYGLSLASPRIPFRPARSAWSGHRSNINSTLLEQAVAEFPRQDPFRVADKGASGPRYVQMRGALGHRTPTTRRRAKRLTGTRVESSPHGERACPFDHRSIAARCSRTGCSAAAVGTLQPGMRFATFATPARAHTSSLSPPGAPPTPSAPTMTFFDLKATAPGSAMTLVTVASRGA